MRIKKTILFKVIRYLITAAVLLSVLTVCVSAEGIRYYGYEQLTDPQKKVYDAIHAAMSADTPGNVTLDASELVKPADLSPAVVCIMQITRKCSGLAMHFPAKLTGRRMSYPSHFPIN